MTKKIGHLCFEVVLDLFSKDFRTQGVRLSWAKKTQAWQTVVTIHLESHNAHTMAVLPTSVPGLPKESQCHSLPWGYVILEL